MMKRRQLALALAMSWMPINAEAAALIEFDCPVAIQAAQTGDNARPAGLDIVAYSGGALVVAGYDAPVYLDLDGGSGLDRSNPVLRDHDKKRIVGQVKARRVGNTIEASGRLVGSSSDRKEVEELAGDGYEWQASVGARPTELVKVKAGAKTEVNGQTVSGPAYIAKRWRLAEISLVTIGADADTVVHLSVAAEDGAGEGSESADGDLEPVQPSSVGKLKAERDRRAKIEAVAMRLIGEGGDIDAIELAMNEAVAGRVTATEFELNMLRKTRPQTRISSGGGNELRGRDLEQAVEASLLLHMGATATDLEAQFNERVINAMDRHTELRHGLSLIDAMQFGATQNRERISRKDLQSLLRASMPSIEASGNSTFSLSGIFSNIANKRMKAAFDAVEAAWRQVSEIDSVSDFKEITSYSLTGDMTYEQVSPTGELKHATVGEQPFTNRAETYGRMFAMTRQDMINDDLGALNAMPRRLGRGGALKLNDVFWSEFQANVVNFFGSANKNLLGSGSAPWYLMTDPQDLAMIQVVFLNGRQVPIVEQADADFKQLGIQFRGYHDFGVSKQEPRAAVKAQVALTLDQLTAAHRLFLDQTDYDNKPLGLMASILLTATGNMVEAANIFASVNVQSGNTGRVLQNNPFAGRFRPVFSAYLANS